ncbi:MAG TPA: NAD(P)/FAD-dependent oxidoreductase [Actinomycetota bacterium]|nr:NAD(P)/FAD-dependent oxidoreductase [Actinomycetota bacterium]
MSAYDAIVVGGGHNGLVCAGYLGRAGLRVLVVERRDRAGGAAATEELVPGVRVPALAHTAGRLRRSVIRDLGLARFGVQLLEPEARVFAPQPDGGALTLWGDPAASIRELEAWSAEDAATFPAFDRKVRSLASFVAYLHAITPPDIKETSVVDLAGLLRVGRAFRRLGPRAEREILRVLPMPVADFVEDFRTDALRGVLAARGIQYAAMGPRSAGTTAVFLSDAAWADRGAAGSAAVVRGGPGALAEGMVAAARSFGVEVRTGAEVTAITTSDDRVTGVAVANGDEAAAPMVISGLDPKRTLLHLLDPMVVGPTMRWRTETLRFGGVVAKVNLVLDALPSFPAANGDQRRLHGRIVMAGGIDDLERAFDASKYGRVSETPYLEATMPTLVDPTLGTDGRHVMSVLVQYTPYHLREGDWGQERQGLGDLVLKALETHAPGLTDLVIERQVITPLDLERDYGMTEGHPLHGEPGLDQFFAWRPLLGHARYRMPVRGLYLCGAGAHPGGGLTGAPGANAAREILRDARARRATR